MSHPYDHARSSARRWGGQPEDYTAIHNFFDESKSHLASWQHRALRHHSEGIFACEREFGITIMNSEGKQIPTRLIGEQHLLEDLGFIPTVADWFKNLTHQDWMTRNVKLGREMSTENLEVIDGTNKV